MYTTLRTTDSVEEGMPTLKKICNYAKWQASGVMGVAIVSALIFIGVVLSPVAEILRDEDSNIIHPGALAVSDPEVEFYMDADGESWANVSFSIQNDDTVKDRHSLMVMIETSVANIPSWRAMTVLLEKNLEPYAYWNETKTIGAHDVDDTTVIITIKADQKGTGVFLEIRDYPPIVIPSPKELYIFDASATAYEVFFDKKANVNVTIFNEGENRYIGRLEVQVFYYYGAYSDFESVQNKEVVKTEEIWISTLTMDALLEIEDIGEPWFWVKLFYDDGDGLEFVDDYKFTGYV